ncbi:hypothetical protein KOR42_01720 [Thalassoglobus neptunius]|uniref:Uncharacterized protein n=1 Tax=Thalassoglobus neptunius TaxID=1938619 RepID=A0A5C5X1D9_9PLAN|nr:hypothetical protein [Thalassoglobus neptunius]TWT56817.1 hypothetical protein KOR42_01720 [Thalassoglobus neptunius]
MTVHRIPILLVALFVSGCQCFQISERYGDCIDRIADTQCYFDRFYIEKLDLTRIRCNHKMCGKHYCPPVAVYPDRYIPSPSRPQTGPVNSDVVPPSPPIEDLPQEFERELEDELKSTFPEAVPSPPEPLELKPTEIPETEIPLPVPEEETSMSVNPISMEIEMTDQQDLTIEAAQILDLESFEVVEVSKTETPAGAPRPFATTSQEPTPRAIQPVAVPPAPLSKTPAQAVTETATVAEPVRAAPNSDVEKAEEIRRKPVSAPASVAPSPRLQYQWRSAQ